MNKKNLYLYKSHEKIYTDPSSGKFSTIRFFSMSIIFLSFFLIPWISWNKSQAFLFDVSNIKLYIFGKIFWPEDFFLFAIFFIILILLLFTVTVYTGRIWCGFLCPQSIWIRFSNFFSRILEGNRNLRKKIDEKKIYNYNVLIKKILKHIIWIIFSFLTSFSFIGYFVSISFLFNSLINFDFYYWSWFWILFFSILTYFNISWFKEQFCFLVCPYARLQSIMFDENTLIVAYDYTRGEKRGSRKKDDDYKSLGLGDCIDCKQCVSCCPTGIDIRNGLQIECIGCAACIDACNSIMKKLSYPQNLIGYMRESDFNKKNTSINKIRLITYFLTIFLFLSIFTISLLNRNLIQFNIIRSQLQLYNIRNDNLIENFYVFKITNKTSEKVQYIIYVNNDKFEYLGPKKITLNSEESIQIDIKLLLLDNKYKNKFTDIIFYVEDINTHNKVFKKNKFVIPQSI